MLASDKKPIFVGTEHLYDYTQNTENHLEVYRLYRSLDQAWSAHCRGKFLMELKKTGNNCLVKGKKEQLFEQVVQDKENLSLSFNYSQIEELEILLRIARGNHKINAFSIETIKSI